MKKIMFYFPLFQIGGTEKAILNLIKELKGFDIYIGYSHDKCNKEILNELSKYAKVINLLEEKINFELDYFISCSMRFHLHEAVKNIKSKHNILWVNYIMDIETTILFSEEVNKLDYIITVSKTIAEELSNRFPNLKEKIKPIYNIIDDKIILEKAKEAVDIKLSEVLNLVTVSRITEEKGFSRMKQLAKILKDKNIDFKWFIIGDNYHKEVADKIREEFNEFKNNFEWLGFMENPHKIVKNCDYSVLLSDNETWGYVITEALILNVPCIVTDFKAAYEQIKDGENGIILSRDNIDSYKNRIEEIINNKKKYKEKIKDNNSDNRKIIEEWTKILLGEL